MLPKFNRDEKTACLKFSMWKKQWDAQILEYDEKYRSRLMMNHLDSRERKVDMENNYVAAITKLDWYYNDTKKIVKACLDEVRA